MLKFITNPKDCILFSDDYFDLNLEASELTDLDKSIIYRIDRAKFDDKGDLYSPYGLMNIYNLSTGTKTLLNIIHFPDRIFNVSGCGPNAIRVLFVLSKDNDITVQSSYGVVIPDSFTVLKINDDTIKSEDDYYEWWEEYENEWRGEYEDE